MSHLQTVLVLAATGDQGGEVARQLLANGQKVHILTRDSNSSKAADLSSAGATVFQGSFDDFNSIKAAASGCTSIFLVVLPTPSELDEARTIVEAARKAGISKCVYSSVVNCEKIVKRNDFSSTMPRASYFSNKVAIQELVISQFSSWTIVQPANIMKNLVDPVARFFFPRLSTEHVLDGPWKPDKKFGWIDTMDIGKSAVAALESDHFDQKIIPLVGESLTLSELATVMSETSGQNIHAEYIGDEAVAAQKSSNPVVTSGDWVNRGWFDVDVDTGELLGTKMNTVKDFLKRQKSSGLLDKTLRGDS